MNTVMWCQADNQIHHTMHCGDNRARAEEVKAEIDELGWPCIIATTEADWERFHNWCEVGPPTAEQAELDRLAFEAKLAPLDK